MKAHDSIAPTATATIARALNGPARLWAVAARTVATGILVAGAVVWILPPAASAAGEQADPPSARGKLGATIGRDALDRMHAEAEEAYRARRWSDAMQAYNAIVVLQPNHAQAWLRIGNLHHRRNQFLSAATAYRKAARRAASQDRDAAATREQAMTGDVPPAPVDPFDAFAVRGEPSEKIAPANAGRRDDTRTKALINLALVNVELAQSALAEIGEVPAELVDAHDEAAAAIGRARGQVERRRRREPGPSRAPRRTAVHQSAAAPPSATGNPTGADRLLAPRDRSIPEIGYPNGAAHP